MSEEVPSFLDATRVERSGESTFSSRIPRGWEQGPGAFGGVVVGLAIRAMEAVEGNATPLRALSCEIPSPVVTDVPTEIRVETLRRGRSLASLEAKLVQDGEVKARATGLFGAARPVEESWQHEPPEAVRNGTADWRATPVVPASPFSPAFVRFLECRPTVGSIGSTSHEARVEGWVRPAVTLATWGAAEVAALADSYHPAFFPRLGFPRPAATIAYNLHTTPAAEGLDPTEPLYYRSVALQLGAGYSFELRELWTAAGVLVALNPQTFAIIK